MIILVYSTRRYLNGKRDLADDILDTHLKPSLCIQEEDFDLLCVGRRTFIKTIPKLAFQIPRIH